MQAGDAHGGNPKKRKTWRRKRRRARKRTKASRRLAREKVRRVKRSQLATVNGRGGELLDHVRLPLNLVGTFRYPAPHARRDLRKREAFVRFRRREGLLAVRAAKRCTVRRARRP